MSAPADSAMLAGGLVRRPGAACALSLALGMALVGCGSDVAVGPAPPPAIVQIAPGSQHTCALLEDASVRCWGDNQYGKLGDGSEQGRLLPVVVKGLAEVTAVSAGASHTCALLGDGTVQCWGG